MPPQGYAAPMPRMVRLRVRRWGGGLAVLLPDPLAREEGLGDGDVVEVTVRKERDWKA